jgi:hypothetical protein
MRVVAAAIGLVCLAGVARAEPIEPWQPLPPLALVMPPPAPAYLPTRESLPSHNDWVELWQRGRQKKLAGATLFGVGGTVATVGVGLLVGGLVQANGPTACCVVNNLATAGAIDLAVGVVAAIAGIPVYTVGVSESRLALRWRDQWSASGARPSF